MCVCVCVFARACVYLYVHKSYWFVISHSCYNSAPSLFYEKLGCILHLIVASGITRRPRPRPFHSQPQHQLNVTWTYNKIRRDCSACRLYYIAAGSTDGIRYTWSCRRNGGNSEDKWRGRATIYSARCTSRSASQNRSAPFLSTEGILTKRKIHRDTASVAYIISPRTRVTDRSGRGISVSFENISQHQRYKSDETKTDEFFRKASEIIWYLSRDLHRLNVDFAIQFLIKFFSH